MLIVWHHVERNSCTKLFILNTHDQYVDTAYSPYRPKSLVYNGVETASAIEAATAWFNLIYFLEDDEILSKITIDALPHHAELGITLGQNASTTAIINEHLELVIGVATKHTSTFTIFHWSITTCLNALIIIRATVDETISIKPPLSCLIIAFVKEELLVIAWVLVPNFNASVGIPITTQIAVATLYQWLDGGGGSVYHWQTATGEVRL